MNDFNALKLIPIVASIREDVAVREQACKSEFARGLHCTLLGMLDAMKVDLDREVEEEKALAPFLGTPEGDFYYRIYHVCTFFEHRWTAKGEISILDPIEELVVIEDDAFPFPVEYSEVPADEMEGLAEVIEMIAQQTGVRFVAARV